MCILYLGGEIMSAKVSSFNKFKIGEYDYSFIVATWMEAQDGIADNLERLGQAIGPKGVVVQAFREASMSTYDEIRMKRWPEKIALRMDSEQQPFMLIIRENFKEFDPQRHPWTIIWFSDYNKRPQQLFDVLDSLAQNVRDGQDIFQYLQSQRRREKFTKWLDYFDAKPGAFGFSIDAKAIVKDAVDK